MRVIREDRVWFENVGKMLSQKFSLILSRDSEVAVLTLKRREYCLVIEMISVIRKEHFYVS